MSNLHSSEIFSNYLKNANEDGQVLVPVNEVICFCTGLTKSRVKQFVLENSSITTSEIALKTGASFHCGGCKKRLNYEIEIINAKSGKRAGIEQVERLYIDKEGKRLKYLNEYPNFWINQFVDLQKQWQEQEDFNEKFAFIIVDAPVPYVDFNLQGEVEERKRKIYFEHFLNFVESKTQAKWYFTLV